MSQRRNRRSRARSGSLNDHQRELLLRGIDFGALQPPVLNLSLNGHGQDDKDFPAGAEAAWKRHRSELMSDPGLRPGQRAYGFWRFDVGISPPANWFDEIAALMDRGMIAPEEAFTIEREHRILSPQGAPEHFNATGLSQAVARRAAAEFALAARWHLWRGRAAIAEKFQRLKERTYAA
jgi:hypothetical protein